MKLDCGCCVKITEQWSIESGKYLPISDPTELPTDLTPFGYEMRMCDFHKEKRKKWPSSDIEYSPKEFFSKSNKTPEELK
jgi:predicted transcriptional regulator